MSKLFLEGFIISHFDVVLDLTGTPQLVVIQGENMILHQQFAGMHCPRLHKAKVAISFFLHSSTLRTRFRGSRAAPEILVFPVSNEVEVPHLQLVPEPPFALS